MRNMPCNKLKTCQLGNMPCHKLKTCQLGNMPCHKLKTCQLENMPGHKFHNSRFMSRDWEAGVGPEDGMICQVYPIILFTVQVQTYSFISHNMSSEKNMKNVQVKPS